MDTLDALLTKIPVPWVLPSAPVLFAMFPPVQVPAVVQVPPLPATVKLPLVFCNVMPLAVPPVDETLVRTMLKGVVLEARVISTAVALLALIVPLVDVIVLLLSVASKPR